MLDLPGVLEIVANSNNLAEFGSSPQTLQQLRELLLEAAVTITRLENRIKELDS